MSLFTLAATVGRVSAHDMFTRQEIVRVSREEDEQQGYRVGKLDIYRLLRNFILSIIKFSLQSSLF